RADSDAEVRLDAEHVQRPGAQALGHGVLAAPEAVERLDHTALEIQDLDRVGAIGADRDAGRTHAQPVHGTAVHGLRDAGRRRDQSRILAGAVVGDADDTVVRGAGTRAAAARAPVDRVHGTVATLLQVDHVAGVGT